MRLLPLVPSAHLTGWTAVADTERAQKAHPAVLARDGHTCRFCGFRAQVRQGVVHLDGNRANPALDNLATACLLCDAVQDLGRPTTVQEMLLVWLPEMSQAVLNGLVRGIHQVLHGEGQSPVQGSRPRQDTPAVRAAWRAYAALAARAPAAELHVGTSSPRELASALLDMPLATYARRAALLGGTRVLHRGRHFRDGADVYPAILGDWARAGAAVTLPAFPNLS